MKTAVEWLIDELNKEMGLISFVPNADEEYKKQLFNIIQQAEEMEKEQSKNYAEFVAINAISGNPIMPFNEFINIDNL
jgi:hypothetical protein